MNTWRHKRSVMRRYDLTAQIYDERYCEEQEAKYRAALEGLSLSAGCVVLDVGCGSGLFFNEVAGHLGLAVGIDASLKLLLLSRERTKNFPNVFLVQADADHLPFRQNVFSHVFAFTMLQNMPKPAKTLNEMKLVSKSNACFVVSGLKAAVSLETLNKLLEEAKLQVVSLKDDNALRCYIARAVSCQT